MNLNIYVYKVAKCFAELLKLKLTCKLVICKLLDTQ